jgi:uncharacterized UPF0160 family protein
MKIVTHNGSFHQDEMFAIAALLFIYPEATIVRTRDDKEIETADIAVDVGRVDDPSRNKFDHHQEGGAGRWPNNVPYASFGLVWKKFGKQVCGGDERVADLVAKKLVYPIDAQDNGMKMFELTNPTVMPYMFDNALSALTPTWRDKETIDQAFFDLLPFVKLVLAKEIEKAQYFFIDIELVKKEYMAARDKRIVVLEHSYPWKSVLARFPEPMLVIHPDQNTGEWVIACVKRNNKTNDYRILLPREWGGKKKGELAAATGVKDAEFCHKNCYIAKAWSKEGALQMAKLALTARENQY